MERDFVISNDQGIHARPATNLVQKANQFKSHITMTYNGVTVDLKSIMAVLSLGVTRGSLISIKAVGEDEIQAMKSITTFLQNLSNE
jgi:phosphocarrier protein